MGIGVHVFPDDVILRADEDTGRPVEPVGLSVLTTRNWHVSGYPSARWTDERTLDKQVRSSIRWLAPFPHDVVQTQVQLVEGQVLECISPASKIA